MTKLGSSGTHGIVDPAVLLARESTHWQIEPDINGTGRLEGYWSTCSCRTAAKRSFLLGGSQNVHFRRLQPPRFPAFWLVHMKWPQTFISIHLLLTAAEQLQNCYRTFILLICGCRTFVSTICNHTNFLHSDWSILNGVQTFISAAEDAF